MADILVVDDEENLSYSIRLALQHAGHTCRTVETTEAALAECEARTPDLALVDVQLPDGSGIELLSRLRERGLDLPVIVITAFSTVDTAVAAMKQGAVDFLQKPLSMEEVRLTVERCLEDRRIRDRLHAYEEAQRRESGDQPLIAGCLRMRQVLALAEKIAAVPDEPDTGLTATLLLGETGTGKEVIARHIHRHSARSNRPFVQVNCTAIPQTLFESELFGHERGTFTDAREAKKGLMETAHEGTLLLDEIGDMPVACQAKLLTVIESGRFRRLGGTTERVADVRVIAATNTDLDRKVKHGLFREDLYYRLKVFCIELPPLRERGDDLFLLADHFLERFSRKFHKPVPGLPPETRRFMKQYPWPGNVRELGNVVQRAILLNEGPALEPAMFRVETAVASGTGRSADQLFDFEHEDCTLAAVEKRLLQAALQHAQGNISEAARLLGLTRGGLRHRLQKMGLEGKLTRSLDR